MARIIKLFANPRLAARSWRPVMSTYRPELYYMRGPGPACARRSAGQ